MPKAAPFPPDETERLEALKNFRILDSLSEIEFDRITELASEIFDAPIVLVSLVDSCRQWFKSNYGLDASETGRDLAFCAYAILGDDVFYVEDATKDKRFFDSPLVVGPPNIRTYAGAPLITKKGYRLGTLCLIYDHVTPLSEKKFAKLEKLAAMVVDAMELRLLNLNSALELQEAHNINENKSRFVAMVSHELRTPMNGVCSMLEVLSKSHLDQTQSEYVQIAKESSKSLLEIINDILDFSKLSAGKMELEEIPFDIEVVIGRIFSLLQTQAQEKNIKLIMDIDSNVPKIIKADPVRLRQILYNLIGNAIKFTESGDVRVRISTRDPVPKCVDLKFEVIDHGIGIAPDNVTNLFNSFEQEDSSIARKFGGTGLGLSICKELVSLMGGEIGAESKKGEGSTFWFTLTVPTAKQALVEEKAQVKCASFDQPVQVLMAEDNMINQKVISLVLSPYNIEFTMANDGIEAYRILQKQPDFDLVFMDIEMPELDGLQTTEKIRHGDSSFANIPIIAMTANMMKGDREKYLKAGMNEYISKPIDVRKTLRAIRKCLGMEQLAEQ